jgi:hypothetical protein
LFQDAVRAYNRDHPEQAVPVITVHALRHGWNSIAAWTSPVSRSTAATPMPSGRPRRTALRSSATPSSVRPRSSAHSEREHHPLIARADGPGGSRRTAHRGLGVSRPPGQSFAEFSILPTRCLCSDRR